MIVHSYHKFGGWAHRKLIWAKYSPATQVAPEGPGSIME